MCTGGRRVRGGVERWDHVMGKERLEGAEAASVETRAQQDIVSDAVTAGFILVWLGATLILGATKQRSAKMMYCSSYGTNITFVQNAISPNAF